VRVVSSEGQVWRFVTDALERAQHRGHQAPLVVLDLDSTLVHTGARHRAIACAYPDPRVAEVARTLSPLAFGWDVRDPLRAQGVPEPLLRDLLAFWGDRFFHSDWLHHDRPAAGAVPFTEALLEAGAQLVYLTARPEPTMGAGTRTSLSRMGFPLGERTRLWMKPSPTLGDAVYKRNATRELPSLGPVAATFENEPGHANHFLAAFPEAEHVLVGSIHDPKAPDAKPQIHRVPDFLPDRA
jgi:hypothetical protein